VVRKTVFIVAASAILGAVQAQVKQYTVLISNPPSCTTCCNGTIGVQVSGCGGAVSFSISIPNYTNVFPSPTGYWLNLCNGVYTIYVYAGDTTSCPVTCSISSGYISPTVTITSNVSLQTDDFDLFPNPTTNALNIKMQNPELQSSAVARLTTASGEIIEEERLIFFNSVALLSTHSIPSGIYILELIIDEQKCYRRRIIIRQNP
jgi:hypothetical protein